MSYPKTIYVYFDHLRGENAPEFLGILKIEFIRNKEVFSFSFNSEWLKHHPGHPLDPDLQFYTGAHYPRTHSNFGLFYDSAPDRWGRILMRRKYKTNLYESDYLLNVFDATRMGALRFKNEPEGPFINDNPIYAAPPWTQLRELETACRQFENDEKKQSETQLLDILIAPGSSLGGARPKANVSDTNGELWIAKFPSHHDSSCVQAWEYVMMRMARDIGINVPEVKLMRLSKFGNTLLSKRFDRRGKERIHFASAMTLIGGKDGEDNTDGRSYLEIAEFIQKQGANPVEDLQELWRRIVFSIAVSNTDDHLRNHGFLFYEIGWRLSPAFDINPNPDGHGLSLNIDASHNDLSFDLALSVADYFRISDAKAHEIIQKTRDCVAQWRKYACHAKILESEQNLMSGAFRF